MTKEKMARTTSKKPKLVFNKSIKPTKKRIERWSNRNIKFVDDFIMKSVIDIFVSSFQERRLKEKEARRVAREAKRREREGTPTEEEEKVEEEEEEER